jgi:PAS domain S-box-containing protein
VQEIPSNKRNYSRVKGGHSMIERTHDEKSCIEAGILDNALVMIAVLGERGRVVSWNHAAETITGYAQKDVISKVFRRCLEQGEPYDIKVEMIRAESEGEGKETTSLFTLPAGDGNADKRG